MRVVVFVAALILAAAGQAWTQTTGLSGLILDPQGRAVEQARILLQSKDRGAVRQTASDDQGRYRFASVAPGVYNLTVERAGFYRELREGIVVSLERNLTVNLRLTVGEVAQQITVDGAPAPVETSASEVGGLVDERRVSELPLNGRDWLQLAELHPGVVRARSTGAGNTSNSPNGRISVSGQRPNATNFFLDGTDISVYSQARPPGSVAQGLAVGVEAIREFRIVTSAFNAEYGGKSGGLVDVITKSGTNTMHGSAYWFHRNDAVDARNFFDAGPRPPPFRRHQFGASLGGPVHRNRTFFFANYERLEEVKGDTSGDVTPNANARRGLLPNPVTGALEQVGVHPNAAPFLALFPLPNGPDFGNGTGLWTGNAKRDTHEDYMTFRGDHRVSAANTLYGRYTHDRSRAFLPFGGNAPFPGFPRFNTGGDHVVTVEDTHTFTPTLLSTLRLGFNRRARLTGPSNPNPGGLSFSLVPGSSLGQLRVGGIGAMGNSVRSEADLVNNVFQANGSMTWFRGRHHLKFGADAKRVHLNDTLVIEQSGTMTFGDLRGFLANTPTLFRGVLPGGSDFARGLRFSHAGFFAQDSLQLKPGFTLNVGIRYEPWSNVAEANGKLPVLLDPLRATGAASFQVRRNLFGGRNATRANWAPRLGFAWDPFGDGKTSIRAGAGLFFDTPYNGDLIDPVVLAPPFVQTVEVRNPGFPNPLQRPGAGGAPPQLTATLLEYDNLHWPSTVQFHFTVQRELPWIGAVLTASYNGMRANHLVSRRELNSNVPQILADGRKFFPTPAVRKNPAVGSMALFATDAKAWYDSLQVNANRRFARGITAMGSYTWSKAIDEAPAAISFTEVSGGPKIRMDSDDLRRDKGLGPFDARHVFSGSLLWDLPTARLLRGSHRAVRTVLDGWTLSGLGIFTSGNPFTPLLSFNHSRSGVTGATATTVDRPNLKPGYSNNPVLGIVDRWYDPDAFELPQPGFLGNLGRNTIIGPAFANLDLSARKVLSVAERARLEIRFDFFNACNHANFDLPGNAQNATSASFLFTSANGRPNVAALRPIRTVNDPRELQLALRLTW